MLLKFWRNPEFIRYVRAELRPARAATAATVSLVICLLLGMLCWSNERGDVHAFFRGFYAWLVGIQYVVLGVWCTTTCGQAIARERELKTYDFLKTTRLTSAELMVGKLLGVPVMAYFVVLCSLPVSIVVGILGGMPVQVIAGTYVLLPIFALFYSLIGLWGSMLTEKASASALGLAGLLPNAIALVFADSAFPGLAGFSILPALFSLHGLKQFDIARVVPTIFGVHVSFIALTILLYVLFGAWLVLMLTRNLKKDLGQLRLLTRWQGIGLAAFLNVVFYALLDPLKVAARPSFGNLTASDVANLAMGLNAGILFLIGVATLTPLEKLKGWWRNRQAGQESYLSETGMPWPWLVPAAGLAYGLLLAEALGMSRLIPFAQWQVGKAAVELVTFLVFTCRDVLFLQWCALTRMKRPVVKGFMFLWLYYSAAGVLIFVSSIGSKAGSRYPLALLTAYAPLNIDNPWPNLAPEIYVGLTLQVAFIVLILNFIRKRIERPAAVPVAVAA